MPTIASRPGGLRSAPPGGIVAGVALVGTGLVTIVIGTFLPWLRSGASERNSYQADGVIARLMDPQGTIRPVLHAWPFVGLGCGLAVALWALGLRLASAGVSLVVAVLAAAVAIGAMTTRGNSVATVIDTGPVITVIGSAIVPIALLMQTAQLLRTTRSSR